MEMQCLILRIFNFDLFSHYLFIYLLLLLLFYFFWTEDAQKLYIRLYNRKAGWFRVQKLEYSEILSIPAAVSELFQNGFIKNGTEHREKKIGDFRNISKKKKKILQMVLIFTINFTLKHNLHNRVRTTIERRTRFAQYRGTQKLVYQV